ncbi:putative lipid II flippase FtsW [Polynucleobacter sp. 86C-FISCH]|jgi:cell division protein FtsW|uniref:Probable peptidoglycan glycosyltransferase FtsW n=1 Tax=Polynucleobacter yangtzensis TaxID=1743159 RepID=A0A9C7CP37_9BURK|nr:MULTISPECIES: putative lipid II flippase FtsW [Polynucleobacter]MBU3546568.1 putative lipid II flippase FtsW [Polynucleobacter sp. MWH-Jannik1A5]MBU3595846.1 putative lipid II flippase FtsW [Polynucleobacter sp. 86C-FISCH]MCX7237478.1 putative lipid II flippase FtsW [Polynucleobacter sp.]BDT76369.1 putative lipid II flippase FtsW [Polynucleobacter yangtzensis]BDT78277.1 putative lipid II flippase FtsW [Polynucleobacter yangtzensis]
MNLKEKFFPENRLGLNRFWNFSRGGIDNFRTGLRDAVSGVEQTRSRMMEYDQLLVWAILSLMLIGLVMVYSASITLADGPKYANYSSNFFLIRHMISLAIAIGVGIWAFKIPTKVWDRYSPVIFGFTVLLLIAVLIPGVGKGVNGAKRWIPLGLMNFQPSELMKFAAVIFAASYTVQRQEYLHSFVKGMLPMGIAVALVGGLLMAEPDMGAFVVVALIAFGILFLGGINAKLFGGLIAVGLMSGATMIALSPFRRGRMLAFMDPWQVDNAANKGYQLTHSLMAFGRGEWFGTGLGGSVEKLHYLPEAHTDFIMAVIGEELGFVGVVVMIFLFYWIVRRAFLIGRTALQLDRSFAGLAAKGVAIWIGWQAFINMGVNLGLLPTKGLTLPLVSYGGSGILMNAVAMAMLLRIDFENRILMRGGKL